MESLSVSFCSFLLDEGIAEGIVFSVEKCSVEGRVGIDR